MAFIATHNHTGKPDVQGRPEGDPIGTQLAVVTPQTSPAG